MAELYAESKPLSQYVDKTWLQAGRSRESYFEALERSTTVYVGNLSFYTTEAQLYEVFAKCGTVKRVVMGLDRVRMTPCGFAFIEYMKRPDTEACLKYLNGIKIDGRVVRVDIDSGFEERRRYGRGSSGGQVRDEHRDNFDADRGGYGALRGGKGGGGPPPAKRQRW